MLKILDKIFLLLLSKISNFLEVKLCIYSEWNILLIRLLLERKVQVTVEIDLEDKMNILHCTRHNSEKDFIRRQVLFIYIVTN